VQSGSNPKKPAYQYLIIGGAPKAATTSLFRYLAEHPDICPASRKETYFFAREFDYKKVCTLSDTLEAFESYLTHCSNSDRLRIEATPYTLYSEGIAQKIVGMSGNTVMLFILRDPVERLFSDYRMQVRRGNRRYQKKAFREYVEIQSRSRSKVPTPLELGCYIEYLRPFFTTFGRDRVIILFFEELKKNPFAEIQKLCRVLGINEGFYSNYRFVTHNKSMNVRYAWLNKMFLEMEPVIANLRARLMHYPKIYKAFEYTVTGGKLGFSYLNDRGSNDKESIPNDVWNSLKDYYEPYSRELSEELGRPLPWKSFQTV